MVIKDLRINTSSSVEERYQWLTGLLNQLVDDQVYLVGETLYEKDISLSEIARFNELLDTYKKVNFLIQDVDSLSFKMLKVKGKSIYKIFQVHEHVQLFESTDEIDLSAKEVKEGLVYPNKEKSETKVLIEDYDLNKYRRIQHEHEEDIVGVLVSDVLATTMDDKRKAEILTIAIDALLRR